jgi:hypothetical protein
MGKENFKTYISDYYKNLFGPPQPSSCTLVETVNQDIKQISDDENEILIAVRVRVETEDEV